MLNALKVFTLTLGASALIATAAFAAVENGQPAPDFTLTDTHGKTHKLSDYKGKIVVLEWLNHGCPFVQKHYNSGNMQSLQNDYTAKDVVWLSINSAAEGKEGYTTPEEANALTAEKEGKATAVLLDADGTVGKLYGAKTTPHMFVINKEGVLVYQGAIDSIPSADLADVEKAENYLAAAVDSTLAGEPVAEATTKAYGCSVKY